MNISIHFFKYDKTIFLTRCIKNIIVPDSNYSLVAEGCRCVLAYIQCFIGDSGKTNHTEPHAYLLCPLIISRITCFQDNILQGVLVMSAISSSALNDTAPLFRVFRIWF